MFSWSAINCNLRKTLFKFPYLFTTLHVAHDIYYFEGVAQFEYSSFECHLL